MSTETTLVETLAHSGNSRILHFSPFFCFAMPIHLNILFHRLLGAWLLPPFNFLLVIMLALWLRRHRRWLGDLVLSFGILTAYLLSIPQMAIWLALPLENYPVISPMTLKDAQAIVVLGGGSQSAPEYSADQPTQGTLIRLRYAAYLARASRLPLLVSGGAVHGGATEARVMADALRGDYGLDTRWLEDQSTTTLENAKYAARLLKQDGVTHIALVSQGWHLRRAVPYFQQQGLTVEPAPTGFVHYDDEPVYRWIPDGQAMQECHALLREWLGIAFYRIIG